MASVFTAQKPWIQLLRRIISSVEQEFCILLFFITQNPQEELFQADLRIPKKVLHGQFFYHAELCR